MLQSRSISGRPLSGRVIDGRALGMRASGAGSASDSLRPLAPVLTWVSDNTVNPPEFEGVFDNTHVWSSGEITGSNFDRLELQIDDDVAFGSFDDVTNDLDAAELLALVAIMNPGIQATGIPLYARLRHIHYVGGVGHVSSWANVETKTLLALDDDDYAAWMAAA